MAKFEQRLQDLLAPVESVLARAPAWFAAAPAAEECGAWDWLADRSSSTVEVTEFEVPSSFIEALFGVHPAMGGCAAMAA